MLVNLNLNAYLLMLDVIYEMLVKGNTHYLML